MNSILRNISIAMLFLGIAACSTQPTFITRDGHRLLDGDQEFRFAGIHAPELHRIEDDAKGVCKADPRGWGQYFKWPTELEQENWIKALVKSGHKAMRVYVLSIATPYDRDCGRETHILPPAIPGGLPRLNESAMVHYDRMIALAGKHNLRLILPFIDHWKWWGGREQLAAFYGEGEDALYDTHSKTYVAYLHIIKNVISRVNTISGIAYKDDPTIMAWETGNELRGSTKEFVTRTAAYIKLLDKNHLVVDGTYLRVNDYSLNDPNIDIISNHYYTVNHNNHPGQIPADLQAIKGKKAYLIGEFGLLDAADMRDIIQAAVHTEVNGAKTAGVFVWGFRGRRQEGGYYWHKEYTGHYSYHLPGFSENQANQEKPVVALVREAQAQMEGIDVAPPYPIPEAPILHPIDNPTKKIAWMGAPLGESYRIERSESRSGPWLVVADNVTDGRNEFNPETDQIFKDSSNLQTHKTYFYRVIARNESGESKPSNIVSTIVESP